MLPDIRNDVGRSGAANPVIQLPCTLALKDRRVLRGIGQAGFMWPQIEILVLALVLHPEIEIDERAPARRHDIDIESAILEPYVRAGGSAVVDAQHLTTVEGFDFGRVALKFPLRI